MSFNPEVPLLLCLEDEMAQGERIAQAGNLALAKIEQHRFPDGEVKLRLPQTLPEHTVILCTLNNPNEKLIALLLAAHTARDLGVKHLTLVAPYLAYMRQDIAFQAGEAISQRAVGGFLARLFDALITVDPHLHRVASLQEAVPVAQAIVLSGAPLLSDLIASRRSNPLLIGPDEESAQWVAMALSMPCVERSAMATAPLRFSCLIFRWQVVRWFYWMMWQARAIPSPKQHACYCKRVRYLSTWP